MKDLPPSYNPKSCEDRWRSSWEEADIFHADPFSKKPAFSVLMPPPNVTGNLHMGHALDDTIQDILTRWKKMSGFETLWLPGTDHAGISTQTVVEKQLMKKYGKHRLEFSREEFVDHIWKWKEQSQKNILSQVKAIGCACDWKRLRFTMDEQSSKAVLHMFKKLFDDGMIYRGNYLVNWDCVTGTALADDEVEYEDRQGFIWTFKYPIVDSEEFIFIATTRPETMLGDTAIAVHPTDERYTRFIGMHVLHPLTQRKIPIVADDFVDPAFGTGAVKITPAHDPNDYALSQRKNLPLISVITKQGRMSEEALSFEGMSILEAREAVVEELTRSGFFVKKEAHQNRVGISYRSKAIIEPLLSEQWFVRLSAFKDVLKEYVISKKVTLIPSTWEHTYFQWIDNLRDWCISRQLWWGHRIPVWYKKNNPSIFICYEGEGLPPEVALDPEGWEQDPDVLDTWFSSAIWPLSTLGWPEKTPEIGKFFPFSTLITGHDIIFFWVARMIMMGHYALSKQPFDQTFLHGLIYGKSYYTLDPNVGAIYVSPEEKKEYDMAKNPIPPEVHSRWEKMSKSKGNVLDPIEIIDEFGADAMRLTLASITTHASIIELDRRKFEEFQHFVNKIWNGARFVLSKIGSGEEPLSTQTIQTIVLADLSIEDRWILSRLGSTIKNISEALTAYQFDKAVSILYEFFWNEFCAIYIELSKKSFSQENNRSIKQVVSLIVLENTLKLLHPFAPFITEELFSYMKEMFVTIEPSSIVDETIRKTFSDFQEKLIAATCYPSFEKWIDPRTEEEFSFSMDMISSIRAMRGEMKIAQNIPTDLFIIGDDQSHFAKILSQNTHLLTSLIPIKSIFYTEEKPKNIGLCSTFVVHGFTCIVPLPESMVELEKQRLQKTIAKSTEQLEKAKALYDKSVCTGKTPPQVLETMEKNISRLQAEISSLQNSLNAVL